MNGASAVPRFHNTRFVNRKLARRQQNIQHMFVESNVVKPKPCAKKKKKPTTTIHENETKQNSLNETHKKWKCLWSHKNHKSTAMQDSKQKKYNSSTLFSVSSYKIRIKPKNQKRHTCVTINCSQWPLSNRVRNAYM